MKLKSLALVGLLTLASLASEAQTAYTFPATNVQSFTIGAPTNLAALTPPVNYEVLSGPSSGVYTVTNPPSTNLNQSVTGSFTNTTVFFNVIVLASNSIPVISPQLEAQINFLPASVPTVASSFTPIAPGAGGGTASGTSGNP